MKINKLACDKILKYLINSFISTHCSFIINPKYSGTFFFLWVQSHLPHYVLI